MASKNRNKFFEQDGYYHVYNRGVGKGLIFVDEQDYLVLITYLKEYLSPPIALTEEQTRLLTHPYTRNNYFEEIELVSFCLMPNHYHFLLKQTKPRVVTDFMRSVFIRYSGYFNKRHKRVGHIFQDIYKGILIRNDEYLWWLSRYIHRNPLELTSTKQLAKYPYSSYSSYYSSQFPLWIRPGILLASFKPLEYCHFVEDEENKEAPEFLVDYLLD